MYAGRGRVARYAVCCCGLVQRQGACGAHDGCAAPARGQGDVPAAEGGATGVKGRGLQMAQHVGPRAAQQVEGGHARALRLQGEGAAAGDHGAAGVAVGGVGAARAGG